TGEVRGGGLGIATPAVRDFALVFAVRRSPGAVSFHSAFGDWLSPLHGTVFPSSAKVSGARNLVDLGDRLLHWPTKSWWVQHRLGDRCVADGLGHRAARHFNLAGD